jgi:hypothetical protein
MCLLWLSSIVSSRGLKKEFFRVVTHQQYIGCLIKTQVRNSSQTIFQAGSPWATLILNSMFVVGFLYCVQLLSEVKTVKIMLSFPFPFLFLSFSFPFPFLLFYFPSSILLELSKYLISQNIRCIMKTQLRYSSQTIFQGGSPWATLILNNMFVCCGGPLLCNFFSKYVFSKFIFSFPFPFLFLSFPH